MILRLNDMGANVADLQRRLFAAGYTRVAQTHVFDAATLAAVVQLQKRARLVADGLYGPKTDAALRGLETGHYLKHTDIERAAQTLDVDIACILAVNEVESAGAGFLKPGCPVILFERHVFWQRLQKTGIPAAPLAAKYPGIVNRTRGGYAGGASEYTRLSVAKQIHEAAAFEATSWGAFQIMGLHWQRLGFDSVQAMVAAAQTSEGAQLDMFVAFIASDAKLHGALKAHNWADFARRYNGPAYADNLYDAKLARAYVRHKGEPAPQPPQGQS